MLRRSRHGYPRRAYRQAFWPWLVTNRAVLLVMLLGYSGLMALMAFTSGGYFRGLAHGFLTATFGGMLLTAFVTTTGTIGQVVGAWGEDNTRDILKWARNRRLVHGWIDNVEVQGGDIDHLVATRTGWIAIDSKWHSRSFDAELIAQDAERAKRAARRASLVLRSLRHNTEVRALAVCWGGSRHEIPDGIAIAHDVEFVDGTHLKRWLRELPDGTLDRQTARATLKELRQFRNRVRPENGQLPS